LSDVQAPSRRNGWLTMLPVAGFALIAVLLYLGLSGHPDEIPSVLIGKPAPEFTLTPLAGSGLPGISLADLKTGKPTLVNVWASWCEPCREEHPLLMEIGKRTDVRLIGMNYKDEPENALKFLTSMGQPFAAIGADADGKVGIDWGVYGVPETYLVDGQGIIRYKWIGAITAETIRAQIDPKIAEMGKGK
jgi:cytochrome c biogenesis protein CcmG, thiol:disulfide interchange protein DsbE